MNQYNNTLGIEHSEPIQIPLSEKRKEAISNISDRISVTVTNPEHIGCGIKRKLKEELEKLAIEMAKAIPPTSLLQIYLSQGKLQEQYKGITDEQANYWALRYMKEGSLLSEIPEDGSGGTSPQISNGTIKKIIGNHENNPKSDFIEKVISDNKLQTTEDSKRPLSGLSFNIAANGQRSK